jgi:pimeloyl-ACP methyl ester carboxylesterase
MSSPVDSLIAGLHSRLDPTTFLAAGSIDERVEMAVRAAGVRLYSHMLAMVWADCLLAWSDRLSAEDKRFLVREMLLLSPNHEHADRLFASLASGTEAPPPNGAPIALVISCRRREYLERAVALRESLVARGTTAWIVIANPDATRAIWIDDGLVVPASDGYEGLPMKVARAIEATIERYGPCPILKIDDDSTLEREFDPHTLSRIAALHEYSGVPCRDPLHDRLWHHGKTTSPMGVYGRRFHAPWASGMCYLLGARAATLIAREAVCFPGEFSCEYYEDKAVGDFLKNDVYFVKSAYDDAVVDDMIRILKSPGGKDAAYATMMRMVSPKAVAAFTPRLRQLAVPTSLIWGEGDMLFPVKAAGEVMRGLIPGATLDVVRASGHEPMVETPAAFMQAFRRALLVDAPQAMA